MKILHIVDENILTWAKPWIQLLSYLQDSGIENEVICRPGGNLGQKVQERHIPVRYYRPPFSNMPFFSVGLGRIIREVAPDVIHTRLSSGALQGGYWGRKYGIPVVSTLDKYAKQKYYRRSDLVVAVSQHLREWICSRGFSRDRTEVIFNPIDTASYLPDRVIRRKTREENGVSDKDTVIIAAGRFVKWKGFDLLVEAVGSIQDKTGIKLWLAGDGPEMQSLKSRVEELDLQGMVKFWGFVEDIRPLLWAGDLFILPSREPEPFGLILLEAMASGLPVIATASGGPLDMVTDEMGCLIPLDDQGSLLRALEQAIHDPSRGIKGESSRKRASMFHVSEIGKAYLDLYRRMIVSNVANHVRR